jgi:hypothetical protein
MDELLGKLGMKYDDLNQSEKETLSKWMESLQTNALTTEKIKEGVQSMKFSVETELIDTPEHILFIFPNRKQILLKARLRNYMLLEAFLTSPERAKQAIEQAILSIKK